MDLIEKYLKEKSPVERSMEREKNISNAILKFAKKYKIGPLEGNKFGWSYKYIDTLGDITMLQKMKGGEYIQKEEIPEKVKKMALKYNNGRHNGISDRWIKLHHFVWEEMLKKEGFLK